MNPGISVQMYTLRDLAKDDFLGAFDQVAKVGYRAVELAGTGTVDAAALKKHLNALGLKVSGTHVSIEDLETDLPRVIEYYKALESPYIICPWWPPHRRLGKGAWAKAGRILGEIGQKVNAAGLRFCYHNHDFEFKPIAGGFGMDIVLTEAGPHLQCELDAYWVKYAGQDPVACIQKYASRLPLLHVKDMQAGHNKKFAQVGRGIIDWPPIFAAAQQAGVQWYVVEQDDCYDVPPLESIRISLQNLQRMGVVQ